MNYDNDKMYLGELDCTQRPTIHFNYSSKTFVLTHFKTNKRQSRINALFTVCANA